MDRPADDDGIYGMAWAGQSTIPLQRSPLSIDSLVHPVRMHQKGRVNTSGRLMHVSMVALPHFVVIDGSPITSKRCDREFMFCFSLRLDRDLRITLLLKGNNK